MRSSAPKDSRVSPLAMETLDGHLDWRIPQIEDLQAAVAAADAGDFADEDDVSRTFERLRATPSARRNAQRR